MVIEGLYMTPMIAGFIGLIVALGFYVRVKSLEAGNETMNRIASYVREGAMAFLMREYKVLAVYSVIVGAAYGGHGMALCFVFGAFAACLRASSV